MCDYSTCAHMCMHEPCTFVGTLTLFLFCLYLCLYVETVIYPSIGFLPHNSVYCNVLPFHIGKALPCGRRRGSVFITVDTSLVCPPAAPASISLVCPFPRALSLLLTALHTVLSELWGWGLRHNYVHTAPLFSLGARTDLGVQPWLAMRILAESRKVAVFSQRDGKTQSCPVRHASSGWGMEWEEPVA